MADNRAVVDNEGIGGVYETFKYNSDIVYDKTKVGGAVQVGLAVTLASAGTVGLAADGNAVKGKLILVESDGFCTVQTKGGCSLPAGTGASLTVGKKIVGALLVAAKGYIREVNTATAAELGLARGEIIDGGDTANVKVDL
jgi:hypothetical protein